MAAFLKNPWPTVFQSGPAPCAKRQIVSNPEDKPSVDITGRYYTENPARTYVINQAGVHIEGFASPVRLRVDASKQPEGDHRPLTSFEGEVRRDKIYWFNRDTPQNFGQFSIKGNQLYLGGQLLKPMEKRPTLFMGTDLDSSFDLPTRHELTPLTPNQLAIIRNILNPYWLNKIFAKFHNDGNGDAVGDLLRRFLNEPPCWMKHPSVRAWCEPRLEQFYEVDLPLVRQYVQLVLTAQIWKNNRNTTLSHVQWIQRMLDVTMGKAPDSAVYQLYKYTGLKRSKSGGTGQHRYEFDFTLDGLSVLLAGYTGTLTVSKKTGPRPWSKQYFIDLWGGNVSTTLVDVKLHNSFRGAAQSDIEWTENDIPGPVRLARASASIGMDTASAQVGFMHLFGNESIPMLPVFFQEASLGYPNVFKILEEKSKTSIDMDPATKFTVKGVVGLDAGVGVLFGTISPLGDALQRIGLRKAGYDPVDLSLTPKWDVSTTHNLSAEVHFCFDTDTPTEAARQAIRIMCARELAQLMSPASTLAVVGHADTIGRADYNKGLSERRASKTVDAIKKILGSKFQIPEANIKMEGKGEDFAAQESKGRTVAAPKHRRVQVFLNAKLVLTLYSQANQPRLSVATRSGAKSEWLEPPITEAEWSEGEDLEAGWSKAVSGEDPEGEELEMYEEFDALEDSNAAETQQSDETPAYEAPGDEWLEMKDEEEGSELEAEWLEGEEPSRELKADYFNSEVWTASAEQIAFQDRVLASHLARSRAAKGPPQRDLRGGELSKVPGTDIKTLPDTAAAAGRLLAAANADLAKAQQAGNADALRTIRLTVNSGYRGQEHQRRRWIELVPKYYNQSQAARERLRGGPHSDVAIAYMLKRKKDGGFGLMGRIAAPGYSNHQGGIAVDFWQERHAPHEIANSTDEKSRALWRDSWFHCWLKANAAKTYGFLPIPTEEWHWEYRPRASRSASAPSAASKPTVSDHLGGKLWTFQAKTLHTRATIYCPKAALGRDEVQVLIFAHGLLTVCQPGATNAAGLVERAPFRFGAIVDRSGRPMVLVVPDLNWKKSVRWHALAKPSNLNAFIAEVLVELGRMQSRARISLSTLIIAGHSRAYGFLEPLAQSREDPEMRRGALAKLSQVWAFDTTYTGNVDLWIDWLRRNTRLQVTVFYRPGTGTQGIGDKFYGQRRSRLIVTQAAEGHCQLPAKRLPALLKLSASNHQETDEEQSALVDQTLDEGIASSLSS